MSIYDFAKRFKTLEKRECTLEQMETKIVLANKKYTEDKNQLKTYIIKQKKQIELLRLEINKMQKAVQKLHTFLRTKTNDLQQLQAGTKKRIADAELQRAEKAAQKSITIKQLNILQKYINATRIFINTQVLPDFIQGFTIHETHNHSEWKPFRIKTACHTQEEVQFLIWSRQDGSLYDNEWKDLIYNNYSQGNRTISMDET
ncbi:uncharacterized protein LOC119686496 [Teleopsis dalmanni]|uniref:uncharacterized protein LOC119686496 n=1 Tax=Teleopsis dalmanni TaxID=139649 RepID=UPI0018CCC32A|nr:uncharacterized protein LOC119686496 [Teleopsis dalmanni]